MRANLKDTFTNLVGLGLGGAGNALFLYFALADSNPIQKTFILSTWSGIFLAGAFLSSFETYQLITSVKESYQGKAASVVSTSFLLFLILGISQVLRWKLGFPIILAFVAIGALTGISISARARAAAKRDFKNLSTANVADGLLRFILVFGLHILGFSIDAMLVLVCYLAGNIGSVLVLYRNIEFTKYLNVKGFVPDKLDLNLAIAGGFTAISTGGLPLVATYIHGQNVELLILISIFTFSRMFLILQTVVTYQDPKFIESIGNTRGKDKKSSRRVAVLTFFAIASSGIYLTGLLTPNPTSINEIYKYIFLGTGIGLGVILNLVLINLQTNEKSHVAALNSVLAAVSAIILTDLIREPEKSFLIALNVAPMVALIAIYSFERNRSIRS